MLRCNPLPVNPSNASSLVGPGRCQKRRRTTARSRLSRVDGSFDQEKTYQHQTSGYAGLSEEAQNLVPRHFAQAANLQRKVHCAEVAESIFQHEERKPLDGMMYIHGMRRKRGDVGGPLGQYNTFLVNVRATPLMITLSKQKSEFFS